MSDIGSTYLDFGLFNTYIASIVAKDTILLLFI